MFLDDAIGRVVGNLFNTQSPPMNQPAFGGDIFGIPDQNPLLTSDIFAPFVQPAARLAPMGPQVNTQQGSPLQAALARILGVSKQVSSNAATRLTGNVPGELTQWLPLIEATAKESGVPAAYWAAAIQSESQGNPNAVGDNGNSIGLLQANRAGGRGSGHTVADLENPAYNLRIAIPEFQHAYQQATNEGLQPGTSQHGLRTIALAQRFEGYNDPNSARSQAVAGFLGPLLAAQSVLVPDQTNAITGGDATHEYIFPVQGYQGQVQPHHGSVRGGSDLMAPEGSPVVAMHGGRVLSTGSSGPGGNNILIQGTDGNQYYYAHLQHAPLVSRGQVVQAGTPLGQVGRTGNAATTPAHLHIGIGPNILNGIGPLGGTGGDFDALALLHQALGR